MTVSWQKIFAIRFCYAALLLNNRLLLFAMETGTAPDSVSKDIRNPLLYLLIHNQIADMQFDL